MRILDRYILKSTLKLFFGCLFMFIFLYIIIDVFSHLDEILRQGVNISVLTQYYLSFLPIIFVTVAPIASLLSTLYTFAKLNRDNEIIAMRAAGLSIFGITKTVIIFGVIVSLFIFWVNDKFVPHSLSLREKIKEEIEGQNNPAQKSEVIYNLCMYGLKNRLFYINKFTPSTNTIEDITILEHDEHQNVTKKIVATKGVYQDGLWRFYKSFTYNSDPNAHMFEEPQYLEEEIMGISETPHDFLTQRQHPEYMTIAQLDNYIWRLSRSGASTVIRNLKVDLYQRFTYPLTGIIIILLGIPFSLMIKKRATGLSSIGISLMLGFFYYIFSSISIALGKAGFLSPGLSVTLSHILGFVISIYMINSLP